jgi:hypothetical protein
MRRFDAPLAVLLGAAVVLAANLAVLGTAGWNRSGDPESRLELTERELALPLWRDRDDSGLVLTLVLGDRPPAAVARAAWFRNERLVPFEHGWLNAAKLGELGFDLRAIEAAARNAPPGGGEVLASPRSAFLVLEYDGDVWRSWLAARQAAVAALRGQVELGLEDRGKLSAAEALLAIDSTSRSRLMPVDAALDPVPLRARYPDRSRHAVVPGFIAVRASVAEGSTVAFRGTIERVAVDGITVPRRLLPLLEPLVPTGTESEVDRLAREDAAASRWPEPSPPRYRATVAYGRHLDPWLVDVAPN